jgi:ketosteroid isomerase-like protein
MRSLRNIAAVTLALLGAACHGDDSAAIQGVLDRYAKAADTADPAIVSQVWSNSPDITFIEPAGNLHGPAQVKDFYTRVLGATFADRNLTMKNVSVHVYGDTAWAEFDWDFTAKLKSNGSAFESRGSETQIYRREQGGWKIVHAHYSGAPVS